MITGGTMITEGEGTMITEFAHHRRLYAVRLPVLGEVLSLWLDPGLRTTEISRILALAEIRRFVRRTDGRPIDHDLAREILDDTESRPAYQVARDRALTAATAGFLIVATCPGCGGWEAELTPLALAVGLRSAFWPLVDGAGQLVPPALALTSDDLTPDDLPRDLGTVLPAARIRVRLPDGRDLPFTADPGAAMAAARHASDELFDSEVGPARGWTPDSPGWIALLRAACLVPTLGGPEVSGPGTSGPGRPVRSRPGSGDCWRSRNGRWPTSSRWTWHTR